MRYPMKNIFTIVLLTVWFYFMPIHALKAETLEFVFSDFPPFEYVEGPSVKGINKEILEEACHRLNVTPVFLKLPWKRALAYVKHGNGDAIFSLFKNEERLKYYNYPDENLNNVKMVLITNKENGIKINMLQDLRGKQVGVYSGSSYGKAFDDDDLIIKDAVNNNEILLRKQLIGRTQVIVMDERVAKYWCKKLTLENKFRTLPYVITMKPTYVAFSKAKEKRTKKDWSIQFSSVLKEMKNDGFIETLNNKYRF